MTTMAPPRPAERHERHERQERQERHGCHVRAALYAWDIPVEPTVAALLTSELVTNAIKHEAGETVLLAISCTGGQFRVDVHDTSCFVPIPVAGPTDAEAGRGLLLVSSLSSQWGFYPTPAGKAVYFTLAFETGGTDKADQPDEAPAAGGRGPQRVHARGRWTVTPPSEHRPRRAALAVPAARLPSA